MPARRLIGILTGMCALSLTLGRTAQGCERRHNAALLSSPSMTMAQHTGSQHTGSQHTPPAKQHQGESCDSSTVVCCQAMTSCGVTFAPGPRAMGDAEFAAAARVTQIEFQTPLSRVATPETPPPKA
jgi:hypothetical protein